MKIRFAYWLLIIVLFSCKGKTAESAEAVAESETPVSVTAISNEPMEEYVELNGNALRYGKQGSDVITALGL